MSQNRTEELSNILHSLFVMNPTRYASQQDNGNYKTINQNLTPVVIKQMLNMQESLLTYQEFQGYMRWVCLDFDIKKGFDSDSSTNQTELISTVSNAAEQLNKYNLPYLIECSGNRGIHLWIILNNDIDKYTAFSFINTIKTSLDVLPESIGIDLFPKTSVYNRNTKGIGLGVKVPLSKHKKSGKYSFFVNSIDDINFDKKTWPETLDNNFIEEQVEILKKYSTVDVNIIKKLFDDDKKNELEIKINNIESSVDYGLDDLLFELGKCYCIKSILKNYRSNLSHTNRLILVGLLSRISSSNNPNLGMDLLKSFFSRLENYDEQKTTEKLKELKNLYPLSCDTLRKNLSIDCTNCICEGKNSPLEALKNVEINYYFDGFSINEELFDKAKASQITYIDSNDEVSIHHFKSIIGKASYSDYVNKIQKLYYGELQPDKEIYKFLRFESESKTRTLVSLSPQDKILSTASLSLLNKFWFDTFSNNSFGYRVNTTLSKGWIFENWLVKWNIFVQNIKSIVYDEMNSYDDYYVIKIDLKSFYDTINHQKLRIKLLDQPISPIDERLNNLDKFDRTKYEHIINYLLKLTKSTNPEVGVPQGPAYARFFAEIYLLGLDKLIESSIKKGFEFYFRFVDDIFLFIENEDKAKKIYNNICSWIKVNDLELNHRKSLLTSVEYFKETNSILKYEDHSKYNINKLISHKSSLTKEELNSAIFQAKNLLNESKFGLKDNFRFVLTKFSGNEELKYEKSVIEPMILGSKFGRGSLYKTFFGNYYLKKNDMNLLSNETLLSLNPLAREIYLNEILEVMDNLDSSELKNHINNLLIMSNLSEIELVTIFQLLLKSGSDVPNEYIKKIPKNVIESIIFNEEKYHINLSILNDEFYSLIFHSDLTPLDFILKINTLIRNNNVGIDELRSLNDYFWNRLSEDQYKIFNLDNYKDNYNIVYNLIALFTITIYEFTSFKEQLKHIWSEFLEYINTHKIKITQQDWFEVISQNDLKKLTKSTIVSCITLNKEQGLVYHCPDYSMVVQRFRDITLAIYNDCLKDEFPLDTQLIESLRKSDKFIEWVYDHSAKMYPDTDICLSNIALNNLILMHKDTSFLVKTLNGSLKEYDHIKVKECNNNYDTLIFDVGHNYKEISSIIKDFSTFEVLTFIKDLYYSGVSFKAKNSTLGYPNFFMKKSRIDEKKSPSIPYYSDTKYLFPSGKSKHKNDHEGYCTLILELVYSLNLRIFDNRSSYSFDINASNEYKLFPTICNTSSMKIEFLFKLIDKLDLNKLYLHAHSFELAWAQTLYDTINEKDNFSKYLEIYLNHHKNNKRKENYQLYELIFNPVKKTSNLSLAKFFDILQTNIMIKDVDDILSSILTSVMECIEEQSSFSDVILNNYDVEVVEPDEFNPNASKALRINSVNYELSDPNFSYYIMDMDEGISLRSLKEFHLDSISSRTLVFSSQINNILIILLVPRSYEKAYETMDFRARWAEQDDLELEKLKLLYNFEKFINSSSLSIKQAANRISPHYWEKDTNVVANRILNWLLLFNPSSLRGSDLEAFMKDKGYDFIFLYESILDIISKHTPINQENVSSFKDKLEISISNDKDTFFTLKNINRDKNGLQHLIQSCGADKLRTIELEDCFNDISKLQGNSHNIVILCDVGISGTEFRKALRFYFKNAVYQNGKDVALNTETHKILVNKECYFDYDPTNIPHWNSFKQNFMNASSIKILTAASTKEFQSKVNLTLDELCKEFCLQKPEIIFDSSLVLKKYNYEHFEQEISHPKKELFLRLINDIELLKKIFLDDWPLYKKSIKNPSKSNLILRLESTPKGRFRLFTMKDKESGNSLFERRMEHNEQH
ncbi:reverse transcriptase domain-containing protein [Vibrio parahaemolyticus]|nr:reverse transcriptase domain-containing protein [Vibrio parahaemolyticus]